MSDALFDLMVVPPGPLTRDFTQFREATKRGVRWDERIAMIEKQFPSVAKLDWYKLFDQDPEVLGHIINDILKVDQAQPGRPGKRPAIDVGMAEIRLRQMNNEDYSTLPFNEAFRILAGKRSVRSLVAKTGLGRNHVHGLLTGKFGPTAEVMEAIAGAFKKDPSYFYEYRLAYILAVLSYKLENARESTVPMFLKMRSMALW